MWYQSVKSRYCLITLQADRIRIFLHRVQKGNRDNQDHLWYVFTLNRVYNVFIMVFLVLYVLKLPVFSGWTGQERAGWFARKTRNDG